MKNGGKEYVAGKVKVEPDAFVIVVVVVVVAIVGCSCCRHILYGDISGNLEKHPATMSRDM